MKYLFKNGTVVSGRGTRRADVLVEDEKICRWAAISATLWPGSLTSPANCSCPVLSMPTPTLTWTCNTTTIDDFDSGTKSAIRGGTTTIVDFACPNKGESLHHGLGCGTKGRWQVLVRLWLPMTIDDWNEEIEKEIDDMYAAGISSFKMYMTYPAMMIGDEAMYKALKKPPRKRAASAVSTAKTAVSSTPSLRRKKDAGQMGVSSHPETRPDFLEAEAVSRLLRIAQAVDIPVVIVHLTNAATLAEVTAARRRGAEGVCGDLPPVSGAG